MASSPLGAVNANGAPSSSLLSLGGIADIGLTSITARPMNGTSGLNSGLNSGDNTPHYIHDDIGSGSGHGSDSNSGSAAGHGSSSSSGGGNGGSGAARQRTITRDMLVRELASRKPPVNIASLPFYQQLARATHLQFSHRKITHIPGRPAEASEPGFHTCYKLKVLYLHDNLLTKIENLSFATRLTHLYLQNNDIERIEGLSTLVNLEKLYLDRNRIRRIEGLRGLTHLEELHLSEQRLTSDHASSLGDAKTGATLSVINHDTAAGVWLGDVEDWADMARSLKVLSLSGNGIMDISPLSVLEAVKNVNLANNRITSPEAILGMCNGQVRLEVLTLTGNTAMTAVPKMRDHIILSTHMLRMLDDREVSDRERSFLESLRDKKSMTATATATVSAAPTNMYGNGNSNTAAVNGASSRRAGRDRGAPLVGDSDITVLASTPTISATSNLPSSSFIGGSSLTLTKPGGSASSGIPPAHGRRQAAAGGGGAMTTTTTATTNGNVRPGRRQASIGGTNAFSGVNLGNSGSNSNNGSGDEHSPTDGKQISQQQRFPIDDHNDGTASLPPRVPRAVPVNGNNKPKRATSATKRATNGNDTAKSLTSEFDAAAAPSTISNNDNNGDNDNGDDATAATPPDSARAALEAPSRPFAQQLPRKPSSLRDPSTRIASSSSSSSKTTAKVRPPSAKQSSSSSSTTTTTRAPSASRTRPSPAATTATAAAPASSSGAPAKAGRRTNPISATPSL